MSSLIEQAALRLAQLREAGVVVPEVASPVAPRPETSAPSVSPAGDGPDAGGLSRQVEIDFAVLDRAGIVTPLSPRTTTADQFRVIKRPLIGNAMGRGAAPIKHGNLIMVTSALPGEGKTFTSINLAMSIAAELDNTVMLVDADVARPSVLRVMGLPPGPGLLDVLEGETDMASALLRTNIEKLSVLPSGTPHSKATELLASDAMRDMLDDMATRYADRIIIFDSPPLLLTTEARVLASHMGQIVVVVQAGRTLQSDVTTALGMIENCPVKMVVLNRARSESADAYGYGYGYGYGEYSAGYGAKSPGDVAQVAAKGRPA